MATIEAPTRVLPGPEAGRQKAPERKRHTGRNVALVGAGGLVLLGGAYAIYEKVPVVQERIDSFFNTFNPGSGPRLVPRAESSSTVKPEQIYDKNADKQTVIAGRNARPISNDEALALAKENPPQLHEGDFPTLPLIFIGKLKNGSQATIETDYTDQAYNPIAQKPDRLNTGKEITFTKAGTEIALTLEEFEVFQIDPHIVNGDPYFAGLVVRFNDQEGIQHIVSIKALRNVRHLQPTKIIRNAPTIGKDGKYLGSYEKIKDQKGLVVHGPKSILITTNDDARVRIGASAMTNEYPSGLREKILFITQDNRLVFPQ